MCDADAGTGQSSGVAIQVSVAIIISDLTQQAVLADCKCRITVFV